MSASPEQQAAAAAIRKRVVRRWNQGGVTLAQLAVIFGLSSRGVAGRIGRRPRPRALVDPVAFAEANKLVYADAAHRVGWEGER